MIERSKVSDREPHESSTEPRPICRNALQSRRFRVHLVLFCALAALFCGSSNAALAGDEADRLQEELLRQQELLSQMEAGEMPADDATESFPAEVMGDGSDPRVAPLAPVERDLPVAIFEISRMRVKSGTWGNERDVDVERRMLDADQDGKPELVRYVDLQSKYVIHQEADTNFDGVTDSWTHYEWGAPTYRVLDSNDDGRPDTWEFYASGRATSREIDRDDDGVRDAFYRYENGRLAEERHDANNDGKVDLVIVLKNGLRVHAEEDQDKDGRMDTWIQYSVVDGDEIVVSIERDRKGRGFADTFEKFEPVDGKATISQREEDLDGDREIDVRSVYGNGKLIRKEVLNPAALGTL